MYNKVLTLHNGVQIPQLGLGTWFLEDNKAADAVKAAVKLGYRHIDTAQAYGNECGVGKGVRTMISQWKHILRLHMVRSVRRIWRC